MAEQKSVGWDRIEVYKKDDDELVRVIFDVETISSHGQEDPDIHFITKKGEEFSYPLEDIDFVW